MVNHRRVPKRSGLMSSQESVICSRLCNVRVRAGWSQAAFAEHIGITRDQLASMEYGRTPIRYWLGDLVCQRFNVCQRWFVKGESPKRGYIGLPPEIIQEIPKGELFSTIYETRIGRIVNKQIEESEAMARTIAQQAGAAGKILEDRLYNLAACWFQRIPPHLYDDYFRELMSVSSDFFQRHRREFESGEWPPPVVVGANEEKKLLTNVTEYAKHATVKSEMANLLKRLQKATSQRGTKSKLAKLLGVPLANVSQWLSGEREPGGETTLRLLRWVEQQEANNK